MCCRSGSIGPVTITMFASPMIPPKLWLHSRLSRPPALLVYAAQTLHSYCGCKDSSRSSLIIVIVGDYDSE
jgi:hypothetical protein